MALAGGTAWSNNAEIKSAFTVGLLPDVARAVSRAISASLLLLGALESALLFASGSQVGTGAVKEEEIPALIGLLTLRVEWDATWYPCTAGQARTSKRLSTSKRLRRGPAMLKATGGRTLLESLSQGGQSGRWWEVRSRRWVLARA